MERDLVDVKQDCATLKEEVQRRFTDMRREFSGISHFLHMVGLKSGCITVEATDPSTRACIRWTF